MSFLVNKAGSLVLDQVTSKISDQLLKPIVDKCKLYRSHRFCQGLAIGLDLENNRNINLENLTKDFEKVANDYELAEMIFDAARSAELSRSKTLGSCVIGILAGRILKERRLPHKSEKEFFLVGEELDDEEMRSLAKAILNNRTFKAFAKKEEKPEHVEIERYEVDTRTGRREDEAGPFLESWQNRLKNLGIVREKIIRIRGEPAKTATGRFLQSERVEYEYLIPHYFFELAKLISRVDVNNTKK